VTAQHWLAVLVTAAFVGLFAWILLWARKHAAQREDAERRERPVRERRARELGWRFDGRPEGDIRYRFEGTAADGLRWTMKFDSDAGSSSSTPKLVWQLPGVRTERLELMIGHRTMLQSLTDGAARKLVGAANFALGRLVGRPLQELHEFAGAAEVFALGSSAADGLALACRDPGLAQRLRRDGELLRLLSAWPRGLAPGFDAAQAVSAKLDHDGLTVRVNIDGPPMTACEQLARLGERLAAHLRRSGGPHGLLSA
jgi:hypothetical protein